MATTFNEGERVQIVDRAATADDVKSGLFYNHFRGLTGTVQKVYATEDVAVEVELDSLTEAVLARHTDVQEQMKNKWLDGLSEEARNRLNDQERDFRLRYSILVSSKDLMVPGPKRVAAAVETPAIPASITELDAPRRPTSEDLEAAEEAYLAARQSTPDSDNA